MSDFGSREEQYVFELLCDEMAMVGGTAIQQVRFPENRRLSYDMCAISAEGKKCFLIEVDGAPHSRSEWYANRGQSGQNTVIEMWDEAINDIRKDYIAFINNIPCIRINIGNYERRMPIIKACIHFFVLKDVCITDNKEDISRQILGINRAVDASKFEDDWETDMGNGKTSDRAWVETRWAYKHFCQDGELMPELIGLTDKEVCEIINAAIPELCNKTTLGHKDIEPKHLQKFRSQVKKFDKAFIRDEEQTQYYQDKVDRIRAEARRRTK